MKPKTIDRVRRVLKERAGAAADSTRLRKSTAFPPEKLSLSARSDEAPRNRCSPENPDVKRTAHSSYEHGAPSAGCCARALREAARTIANANSVATRDMGALQSSVEWDGLPGTS